MSRYFLPRLKKICFLVLLIATAMGNRCLAQSDSLKRAQEKLDSVKQLDLLDVISYLFRIDIAHRPDTAKIPPGKILPSATPAIGYTLEGGWVGNISANLSFYTADMDHTNLSAINTAVQYSQREQFTMPINSDIWLPNNKYDLLGSYVFYKYPSNTYGLGSNTNYARGDIVDYSYIKVYQEVLRHIEGHSYIGAGYNLDYHYNIEDPHPVTDFQLYNNYATQTTSSGIVFHYLYDSRTNPNNPKKAFYGSILYRINTTFLGSSENWQMLQLEVRKYFKTSAHTVLAFWSWNEFTFGGKAPYFDLPSNGWDTYNNTGRGYIQGRFRGPDMLYDEAEFRFRILNSGLLGGVVFVNATSVSNWPQKTFTEIFPGEGVGLRIKFNKYSDVNICVDYAIGEQNSHGFFFNLAEIF